MAKRNPESSSTGDQGEALVDLIVSKMGHIWQPAAGREVAIDGAIELFTENRESTSRFLSVQVKARTGAGGQALIRLRCDPADIAYWRRADRPVLVVLVDPDLERAWFVCAQEYFSRESFADNTVHFDPSADRFDDSISDYLFELASVRREPPAPFVDGSPSTVMTSRHVLHHFHRALSLAISDHQKESIADSTPLFLDADVAVSATLPLQTLARSMDRLRDDHVYSTMLWRLGYLGPGTLLMPHAVEFDGVLHRCQSTPRDDMATLLRHQQTRDSLAEMRLAIQDPDAPVATLMEQLRRVPRETAMLVAMLIQTSQPIRSIGQVLTLGDDDPRIADIAYSPVCQQIYYAMKQHASLRHNHTSQRAMQADSIALAMLAERVERYRNEQIASVGYFATRTSRIISILRDEQLRHLFVPDPPRDEPTLGPRTGSESVLRTSEYLICRSTFACLRKRESLTTQTSRDSASLSLDAVETCADQLTKVLHDLRASNTEPNELFRLERLPMSDVSLAATVDYLKSLASLDTIWLADDARGLRHLCRASHYLDVEEFVIDNYTKMIAWTQQEFASRTASATKWRAAYQKLIEEQKDSERI